VSLDFNLAGQSLPPVDPALAVANHPKLCWGITFFDMWIGNPDRHNQNMAHDTATDRVQIFDHSHALLAVNYKALGPSTGLRGHCLRTELVTLAGLKEWHDRIMSVPEYYIRSIVSDVAESQFGVTPEDAISCADFLLARRANLIGIAKANMTEFPKVPADSWNAI
jgi:hypothetical protein